MYNSIFASVTSAELFVKSISLQIVNKVVFEAAAQSGDNNTVAQLEGYIGISFSFLLRETTDHGITYFAC